METRPKASFSTIGCKLNQYETEGLKEHFRSEGFEVIPFGQEADVVVVNTCTVTAKGDRSSRQALRRAVKSSPGAIVAAVGCYAQISPQQLASIPGIDLVVGTSQREHLVELLRQRQENPSGQPLVCRGKFSGFQNFDITCFDRHTRVFVKVQEGCDNRCAYCIVPFARGPSRSRPLEDTLQQVDRLVNRGYKEIVLTGVCLGIYGWDLPSDDQRIDLRELVKRLEELKGLARYRLSSIEPSYISEELVDLLSSSPKLCHHLHIPLQSGDTQILERMGRSYSAEEYRDLLWMLKTQMPDLAIGADVIVGFPGETEDHFQNTYRLIQNLPLSYLHVFRFSPRKGTAAYQMEDRVDDYT
ncbi:MAG: tRNA (N(6)-L-threonylcarbamoyladenosine(37)-C(2))-methylthiotransferase MtaB, partial [Candidatus Latescibacteria bacterium]|nr:tRNA (N(6)-L-threonylcarbamoyladenosine(37)-C(2))-methylthiotransferase MtaB [Candidatus Latescibacterota bacterium]